MQIVTITLALIMSISASAAASLNIAVLTDTPAEDRAHALIEAVGGQAMSIEELHMLTPDTLLVLLETQRFPGPALGHIIAHLDRGGHLLVVGGPAFETLLHEGPDGDWMTLEQRLAIEETPSQLVAHDAIDEERFDIASGLDSDEITVETGPDGLTMISDFKTPGGWSNVKFSVDPPPAGHNIVRIRGSIAGEAESLVVEVQEQDGSRWMATLRPVEGRDEFVAHESQFVFWGDSPSVGRGGPGDQLQLDQAGWVSVGFASTHQVIHPGEYAFTVSSVESGRVDTEVMRFPSAPPLEGLCPAYKTFTTTPTRSNGVGIAADIDFTITEEIVSPIARPMHPHPELDTTWQPLVKGYNAQGIWNSTPVSTTWRDDGATWTFIGFVPETEPLATFAQRLATAIPDGMPDPGPREELREPPATGALITVEDNRFMLDGEPWFAHGINFWPLYVSGMEPKGYFSHWLAEPYYIVELIKKDLDLLESMGVNLVSIQYTDPAEAPQLRDFVARCYDRGIFVNIFIAHAHPTEWAADDDLSQRPFVELVRRADLADVPSVFAYDLAWEPAFGDAEQRAKHDHLFEAWVIEQYGSIERAEEVWEFPINRREDGGITGPTNYQVLNDGDHRVMVAAYRRFKDDLISHRYREIIRIIDEIDDTHLYGVRTGLGGTGTMPIAVRMPFQLTSGAAHLDFTSPEGWGYTHDNIADAVFVTQYSRWAGNNKPVFWAEFGMSVWEGGDELQRLQGEAYDAYRVMLERTSADGWAGWWFPGGYRVDERSDYGIINPDRSLRPAAELLAECGDDLKDLGPLPEFEPVFTVHRDEHPVGLPYLVNDRRDAYTEAWDAGQAFGVQTPGTGTTSADCPFTGVGGVPFSAPQPPEYLNAEIVVAGRNGATVEITLINTGEATWLAQDCGVRVSEPDGTVTYVALPEEVPRFGRLDMTIPAPEEATLALEAERFGPFGERVHVD